MSDYVRIQKSEGYVNVWFLNECEKPFNIGEKMNEINEQAYMNGYNWAALLDYYLSEYAPDVLEGLDHDPEAGSYVGHYEFTAENKARAEKFAEVIRSLIENEEELYRIVREKSNEINWD